MDAEDPNGSWNGPLAGRRRRLRPLTVTGDGEPDDGAPTVFRDMVLLALAGFVAIVLLLLPHVNPPGVDADSVTPPGNVIVELFWEDDRDVDIDLWVAAPGDPAVGYSNRGAVYFNLLRDDLGIYKDATPINYEVAYSRGIAAGEHIANLHLYRLDTPQNGPVDAKVVVTTVNPVSQRRAQLVERDLALETEGEEVTAFRFALTEDGELVPGSVNARPIALRSGNKD